MTVIMRRYHTLENSNLCFEDLVAYSKAISSIEVYDNISFADTGRTARRH